MFRYWTSSIVLVWVISLKPGTVNLRNLQRPWTPHCHWPGTLDGRCHQLQPVGLRHFSPSASLSIFHILCIIIFIYQIILLLLICFLFYLYIVFQISVPVLMWIQACHVFHTHAVLKSRPATSWPPTLRGPGKTHRSALLLQHRVTAKYEWMW